MEKRKELIVSAIENGTVSTISLPTKCSKLLRSLDSTMSAVLFTSASTSKARNTAKKASSRFPTSISSLKTITKSVL